MLNRNPPTRRSRRHRQPNKRYSIDAVEGTEDLIALESEVEIPDNDVADNEDAEFNIDLDPEPPAQIDNEDHLSLDEGSAGDASNQSTEDDEVEDVSNVGSDIEAAGSVKFRRKRRRFDKKPKVNEHGAIIQVRGIPEFEKSFGKGARMEFTFGLDPDDIIPYLLARDKWSNNATLPTRHANSKGFGGMYRSFYFTAQMQERERDEGWRWYYDQNGLSRIREKQNLGDLDEEQAGPYMDFESPAQIFFIGPGSQSMQTLNWGEPLNISKPWEPETGSEPNSDTTKLKSSKRRGWIMNLASKKVQCLDWVPNNPDSTQYLAVAIENAGPYAKSKPYEAPDAPAFTARPSTPASLQIWSFQATQVSEKGSWTIDTAHIPKLRLVLCTDWGDIRSFRWCPMLDRDTAQDPQTPVRRLGLLAGVWADGFLRVIDVSHTASRNDTEYVHVSAVALEARPPNGVFTGLTWLSTSDIAASTAHGFVAIFNLANCIKTSSSRPWFFKLISDTYILDLTSGYPSRPHLLFTTSMSGYMRMTDLRAPESDSVESLRSRLGSPTIAWHDSSQCLLACDDSPAVRLLPVRRFFASMLITKLSASAPLPRCLVTSPVHPSTLVGLADGSVLATNPLPRIQSQKSTIYLQKWFHHEFSGFTPQARHLGGEAGGVVRFSDGFKVENPGARETKKEAEARKRNGETGFKPMIVYEEKTSITALAWNPNMHCGGWAAAGMGSGLLRVEDIALDRSG